MEKKRIRKQNNIVITGDNIDIVNDNKDFDVVLDSDDSIILDDDGFVN